MVFGNEEIYYLEKDVKNKYSQLYMTKCHTDTPAIICVKRDNASSNVWTNIGRMINDDCGDIYRAIPKNWLVKHIPDAIPKMKHNLDVITLPEDKKFKDQEGNIHNIEILGDYKDITSIKFKYSDLVRSVCVSQTSSIYLQPIEYSPNGNMLNNNYLDNYIIEWIDWMYMNSEFYVSYQGLLKIITSKSYRLTINSTVPGSPFLAWVITLPLILKDLDKNKLKNDQMNLVDKIPDLIEMLDRTRKEVSWLREQVKKLTEENKKLNEKYEDLKEDHEEICDAHHELRKEFDNLSIKDKENSSDKIDSMSDKLDLIHDEIKKYTSDNMISNARLKLLLELVTEKK